MGMAEPQPAKALGILDKTGTLTPGKMADVVLWNGDPFSDYTRPERVWINGAMLPKPAAIRRSWSASWNSAPAKGMCGGGGHDILPACRRAAASWSSPPHTEPLHRTSCGPLHDATGEVAASGLAMTMVGHTAAAQTFAIVNGTVRPATFAALHRREPSWSATGRIVAATGITLRLERRSSTQPKISNSGNSSLVRFGLAEVDLAAAGDEGGGATNTQGSANDSTTRNNYHWYGDRRRSRAQSAQYDDRGQPRRRSHASARGAIAGSNIFAGQGAVIEHRRGHGPGHRGTEIPVRRARPVPAPKKPAARAPRLTCCSAMLCVRRGLAEYSRRVARPMAQVIVRNPNESRLRRRARTCS